MMILVINDHNTRSNSLTTVVYWQIQVINKDTSLMLPSELHQLLFLLRAIYSWLNDDPINSVTCTSTSKSFFQDINIIPVHCSEQILKYIFWQNHMPL